jgi:hypothetical protein
MELKKVNLINVRNFTERTFNFNSNTELVMPNEGGKSTLADAITFVLIGKLYSGSSDVQSLKPLRNTAEEVSVELIYTNGDEELSLMKTYKENWVKTRGTTEVTMSGHTTDCFINEKKMTVSNFEKELCGYFNVKSTLELNIMLNPYYFGQVMSWQDRLEYVSRVTGEVTVDDVINITPAVREIKEDILRYGDDVKNHFHKDAVDKKKMVDDQTIQIKGDVINERITESEFKAAAKSLEENNSQILKLKVKQGGINDPVLQSLKADKLKKQAEAEQSKAADRQELARKNDLINKQVDELRNHKLFLKDEVSSIKTQIDNFDLQIEGHKRTVKTNESLISRKRSELASFKEDYSRVIKQQFKPLEAHHCPNCDFDLTAEENEKKKSEFNINQAKELKNITVKGNALVDEIKSLLKEVEEANGFITDLEIMKENTQARVKEAEDKVKAEEEKISKIEASKTYCYVSDLTNSLVKQLEAIEKNIAEEENKTLDEGGMQSEIGKLQIENMELQKVVDEFNAQKILIARKQAREKELVRLAELLAKAEYKEELLAMYNKTYLRILNERVEKYFPGIKFEFIKNNIKEGSWQQVCYVLVESEQGLLVPYETANTASKIKIGVRIANLLADALGWNKLPMVIDNAEAVTRNNRHFDTEAQIITLVADDINEEETKNQQFNNEQQVQLGLEI